MTLGDWSGRMNRTCTYETWAFSDHSLHLCSIRRTRYCSLGRSISGCCRASRDSGREACSVKSVEDGAVLSHIQPDKHGLNSGEWLEQTYRMAARTTNPSESWPTTGCRKGHKRGIWSSVQWGQARAGTACRRNGGCSSGDGNGSGYT